MNADTRNPDSTTAGELAGYGLLLALLVTGVFFSIRGAAIPGDREQSFSEVLAAVNAQERNAADLIAAHLRTFPDDTSAIYLAGEIAAKSFEHEKAIEYYRALPRDRGEWELLADLGLARRYRVLGLMLEEEQCLRNVLSLDPMHADANHRFGHLLQVQGRTWESAEFFMNQLRRGKCRGDELMGVATTERFFRADEEVDHAASKPSPPQAISQLGNARRLLFENRNAEAEVLFRRIVLESPQIGEAQGRLGRLIVERGDLSEFLAWRGVLPEAARQHPEVWFVQGLQARRSGLTEGAVYCFLKALELSPNHLPANVQISGCLSLVSEPEAARFFTERAELLSELETILNLLRDQVDESLILKAVARLEQLHRYWEASGWLYLLSQLGLPDDPERPTVSRWASAAIADPDQNAGFADNLRRLNLSRFSEPNWNTLTPSAATEMTSSAKNTGDNMRLSLQDEAEAKGISVQYFEGTQEANRLEHIFSVVGGGLAAVDIDLDGWPDLHIAQADDWRNPQTTPVRLDTLYRNIRGDRFEEIAAVANLIEPGFSHGISAEDFDQDGFTDILVCNLKSNRLFRNNGDGSFQDVTVSSGIGGDAWSIGGMIADFSGDGLPDIYIGNYSKVQETAEKICHRPTGQQMACTPDVLTAESDRLYLNIGDGTFQDITDASGIRETSGRALGMIGWDFTGNGHTSIFVANDTSANFLFHNIETDAGGVPKFQEEGILRGLAFDADGNAQASMGVAASDANSDGRIDLFITNFANESNTFYTQGADGTFYDFTRQVNLRDAGYAMLGFGTQFVDVDGDGWEDLVASNGHVDQSDESPGAEKMKPQVFRSLNGEGYTELAAESCGSYFEKSYIGRAIATLDWNRDGKPDFGVSHLHAPFSLVTNRTEWSSDSVIVRLAGRRQTREANGAKLRMRIGGRDHYRFALSGDGYLVTNEPIFVFAVPAGQSLEELEITWPGGAVQTWKTIATLVNTEVIFVEGRDQPYLLRTLNQ